MKHLLTILAVCLLWGCNTLDKNKKSHILEGAWLLQQAETPLGDAIIFSENNHKQLRLYNGDSVRYQCTLIQTGSALIVQPNSLCNVTVINKGNSEYIYLEETNLRPLTILDDSTIVIQEHGYCYTWRRNNNLANEWGQEIKDIISNDFLDDNNSEIQSYVLSAQVREQANVIHVFIYITIAIIFILFAVIWIAIDNRKSRRRLQLQLQQIQEVREERSLTVKQAIEHVESTFFTSDEYETLQRRIATGQRLKEEEWHNIESQIKKVYPGYISQLRNLYSMSELEFQVCLLIKLRITPSDIASILARDASTISTVRSRLYKKVFGQKGGTKEWDDFILSIGT